MESRTLVRPGCPDGQSGPAVERGSVVCHKQEAGAGARTLPSLVELETNARCSVTGSGAGTNLISPECVTPPRLLNTALRGRVTNFVTFTCLHHANNANVK